MAHRVEIILREIDPDTGKTTRQKNVYDEYTAECFAADWYMNAKKRPQMRLIYLDDSLRYGLPWKKGEPEFLSIELSKFTSTNGKE